MSATPRHRRPQGKQKRASKTWAAGDSGDGTRTTFVSPAASPLETTPPEDPPTVVLFKYAPPASMVPAEVLHADDVHAPEAIASPLVERTDPDAETEEPPLSVPPPDTPLPAPKRPASHSRHARARADSPGARARALAARGARAVPRRVRYAVIGTVTFAMVVALAALGSDPSTSRAMPAPMANPTPTLSPSPTPTPAPAASATPSFAVAAPVLTVKADGPDLIASWRSVAPGTRYRVQYASDPTMTDATSATVSKLSYTLNKLTQGTEYYVRARALTYDGSPASEWSQVVTAVAPESQPLVVASYNIRCAHCKGGPTWGERRPVVASTILGQMPDALGVQEADGWVGQFSQLLASLGSPYQGYQPGGGHIQTGIVYNSQTLELIARGTKALARRGTDRRVVWAVFRQKSTGIRFLFGATHLDQGASASDGALRVTQANQVVAELQRVASAYGDLPTIVVGDLNSYPGKGGGNGAYDVFVKNYLDPMGRASDPGVAQAEKVIDGEYSSWNGWGRLARKTRTYLDYVFVTPMRVSEWQTVVNVDARGMFVGTIPSDHNMVRATVYLPWASGRPN